MEDIGIVIGNTIFYTLISIIPGPCCPILLEKYYEYSSGTGSDTPEKNVAVMYSSCAPGISMITGACVGFNYGMHCIKNKKS